MIGEVGVSPIYEAVFRRGGGNLKDDTEIWNYANIIVPTVDLIEVPRFKSLDGLGGAAVRGVATLPLTEAASSEKKVWTPCRPALASPLLGKPINTRASRLESWLGFSRRRAFCVASRAPGDGGRGAGFIVWATARGIVGMLQDETTGPKARLACAHDYGVRSLLV